MYLTIGVNKELYQRMVKGALNIWSGNVNKVGVNANNYSGIQVDID